MPCPQGFRPHGTLTMNLDLAGRTALITGSTRGIGFATLCGLADLGAGVVLHGRTPESVARAVERFRAGRPDTPIEAHAADLGTADGCAALTRAAPVVDILVNNVGIYHMRPFADFDDAEWDEYFVLNVMSGVRLARHYLPAMRRRDWGRIVFVSSESGVHIPPDMIPYGFSKAAQLAIGRGLAETTGGTGVTVNSVLPGPTWVETQAERLRQLARNEGRSVDELKRETFTVRKTSSLLGRYTTPEEVANLICYVCSPASAATNGASLRADGGIVRNYI